MSETKHGYSEPEPWWKSEPHRWERDRNEITDRFPELSWEPDGAGAWEGRLPLWPFERAQPAGLAEWTDSRGLHLRLGYSQAYPMIAPQIYPLEPEPLRVEWTQHRWHVNGDGSLCLLRTPSAWTGREPVTDLLLKAAGWRIEYALLKHGAIEEMTENGIVDDDRHDHLLSTPPPRDQVTNIETGTTAC